MKTDPRQLTANRAWRDRNAEYDRARCRATYARRREDTLARKRAYYQEVRKAKDKTPDGLLKDRARKAKRRGAIAGDVVTPEEWAAIIERFDGCCAYCGDPTPNPEQDHVIPLSKRGRHLPTNVVPACKPCNSSKGNR